MLRAVVVAFALALAAPSVQAEEVIATAANATPPDVSKAPPPGPLLPPKPSNLAPVQPGPCGLGPVEKVAPVDANGEPAVDHSPHGEVSVGMGSHGYRFAEGSVCVPVGENGFVAVDVGTGQFGRR